MDTAWLALGRSTGYGPISFVGLANFWSLLVDPLFQTSLAHSAVWELAAALIPTLVGLVIALAAWPRVRGSALAIIFFPALLPPTVVAAIWVLVYSPLFGFPDLALKSSGLPAVDWLGDPRLAMWALFAAWTWSVSGIGALIFWIGLRGIGREYLDVARLEGAGPIHRLQHVILPALCRPAAVVIIINLALASAVFDLVFTTTGGGPGYATMVLPVDMYGRAFGGNPGQGAAEASVEVMFGLLLAAAVMILIRGANSLDTGSGQDRPRGRSRWLRLLIPGAILASLTPLLWLLVSAFEPASTFLSGRLQLDPLAWRWQDFGAVWNAGMGQALATSAVLSFAAVVGVVALGVLVAFALGRLRSRYLRATVVALLLAGLFQPTPVLIIPLFSLLKNLGLQDSLAGIALPEIARALPFGILILWAFLSGSPREILEASRVDGASSWQELRHVALPLARSAVYAAGVWAFITSWNEYLLPTVVSQDGSIITVPTLLASFIGKYDTQFGLLAAGSLLAALPLLVAYIIVRRPAGMGISSIGTGR